MSIALQRVQVTHFSGKCHRPRASQTRWAIPAFTTHVVFLTSRIYFSFFLDFGVKVRTYGLMKILWCKVPLVAAEKLVLSSRSRYVFSSPSFVFGAINTVFWYNLIFQELAEWIIFYAAPSDHPIQTLLVSFCGVQLRTPCAPRPSENCFLLIISDPRLGELPCFLGFMIFHHALIHRQTTDSNKDINIFFHIGVDFTTIFCKSAVALYYDGKTLQELLKQSWPITWQRSQAFLFLFKIWHRFFAKWILQGIV